MALLTLTALLLISSSVAEIPHEDYDRARLNLEIVHLFLETAFRRAEAALAAAADERLEEAEENLTLFRAAMESAMETLEEVNPSVPSYPLIAEEMSNISSLYNPLLDVVGGLLDLFENLDAYINYTVPLPGALASAWSLLENLTTPFEAYSRASASLRRAEGGAASLREALINISSAYDTSGMMRNLKRVVSLLDSTYIPPFLPTVLSPVALFFEEEVASSLLLITEGEVDPPLPEEHAASISGANSAAPPDLRAELGRVFPYLLFEYTTLSGLISRIHLLYELKENVSGPFYRRVSSYYNSMELLGEMEAEVGDMENFHGELLKVGAGSEKMGEAIDEIRVWLFNWRDGLTHLLNLTGELHLLSGMISHSVGGALWDYDRDGDSHLDVEEILLGWSLQVQERKTEELLAEVEEVRRAVVNFTGILSGEFLSVFDIEEEGSELCREFLARHRAFLQVLQSTALSPTLEAIEALWGYYGALNSTFFEIVEISRKLDDAGYPLDNTSLKNAEKMLEEYYRLIANLTLTLPEGLIIYTSKPSYPLGDILVILGRAYMNGPLKGKDVNITLFSQNFTVRTTEEGAFSLTLPIPFSTAPGRYTAEARIFNMSANCTFRVTLIPVKLSFRLTELYAEPGEEVPFQATSEDLWGESVNSTLLLDGNPFANINGSGGGTVSITSFGTHAFKLAFAGDPYHLPRATPEVYLNISLPLTLLLSASNTTLYRNSSVNLTLQGAPPGRYVEFISAPSALQLRVLAPQEVVNVTLRWGDLPPGEYLLRAIYRAQDPIYRDAESNPLIIRVVDEEPPLPGEGKEENQSPDGIEPGGDGAVTLPSVTPYEIPPSEGGRDILLYAAIFLWATALSFLLLYMRFRRSREEPSELTLEVEEKAVEEGGEEEVSEEVVVGVPVSPPEGAPEHYFRVLKWIRERGVPVAEHHTPREMLRIFTEVEGHHEELERFVEVFERYTYGPVKRDEDLRQIAALAERITGVRA